MSDSFKRGLSVPARLLGCLRFDMEPPCVCSPLVFAVLGDWGRLILGSSAPGMEMAYDDFGKLIRSKGLDNETLSSTAMATTLSQGRCRFRPGWSRIEKCGDEVEVSELQSQLERSGAVPGAPPSSKNPLFQR